MTFRQSKTPSLRDALLALRIKYLLLACNHEVVAWDFTCIHAAMQQRQSDKGIVRILCFDCFPGCEARDFYSIHTKRRCLI